MKAKAGLWIDHRQAVIVVLGDRGEEIRRVPSNLEKQLGRIAGVRSTTPYSSQHVPADDARERDYRANLDLYYDQVIAHLREAEAVLVFGPGEAKGELKMRMEKHGLGGRIAGVETADKMTDHQIAAKVRRYFPA